MADQAEDTHNGGKLPMPRFSGEGQSGSAISLDAELFLGRFEDWTQVCNYANERKAKALGYALTKAAATWYQQTCRRRQVDTNSWADIRAAFSTRFMKKVSPRYIATELNQLTQRHKESVADFLDRCELAQTLLDDQWKVEAGATHQAERKETLTLVHEKLVLHHFLRHLRSDISEKLAFCPDLESLDDHVKAAERIEKAESDRQHKAPLATMSEVNAFQPARQQQSQQQQKKKKQPGPNYLCRLCGVAGHVVVVSRLLPLHRFASLVGYYSAPRLAIITSPWPAVKGQVVRGISPHCHAPTSAGRPPCGDLVGRVNDPPSPAGTRPEVLRPGPPAIAIWLGITNYGWRATMGTEYFTTTPSEI